MSTWRRELVPCPACGVATQIRIAVGAHVGRAPQVRDQVLARTFHRLHCACGAITELQVGFEYTDLDRKQLVLVAPPGELGAWPAWETRLRATVARAGMLGSPLATEILDGMAYRVVFGLEELREKLVLWSAGFDDALVECMKVRALAADPSLGEPRGRLLVDEIAGDDSLVCRWFADATDLAPARRVTLPAGWSVEAERDRASLATRFRELFDGGFVSMARLLVAAAVVVGCSSPPIVDRSAHPVAAVVDAAAVSDAAPSPDAPDPNVFPWQEIRDQHEAFMKTPVDRCDWRWIGVKPTRVGADGKTRMACLHPPRPQVLAGKTTLGPRGANHGTSEVVFDLGSRDDVDKTWFVALLDEQDRVISSWAHPHQVGIGVSRVVVDVPIPIAETKTRVALRRKLEARE